MHRHSTVPAVALALAVIVTSRADLPAASALATSSGRQVHVFNTQLRGIIDPDIEPSAAYGHVQVKLTEQEDGTYAIEWRGRLFNPAGEEFTTGLLLEQGPIEIPDGEQPFPTVVTTFFRDASAGCDIIDFDSLGVTDEENLPAEVGLNFIINPDVHVARLVSADGTTVLGRFGPGTAENASDGIASSFDGRPVRCSAGN